MTSQRAYTAAEVDAAIVALQDPDRFAHARDVVTHAAPGLGGVLADALADGGWFGPAHEDQLGKAVTEPDAAARLDAVRALVTEQTHLGMLVGVAVGFELARELASHDHATDGS